MDLIKSTIIDGVAATEDRDSEGEILSLDGADIDQMVKNGYFNDNHGKGFINTLGRIIEAKKIKKESDASTPRQKYFWKKYKRPLLYVKGYLFDSEDTDHPNAKAVSAIMKEFDKAGTSLDVKMSVEGKVKGRGHNGLIKESLVRNVALTLVPANKNTGSMIIGDTVKKSLMDRVGSAGGSVEYADTLLKSMGVQVVDSEDSLRKIHSNIQKVNTMIKALSAGYGASAAPQSRADGAAVSSETITFNKKKYKKDVLKTLIKKVCSSHPDISMSDVIKISMRAYSNKFGSM